MRATPKEAPVILTLPHMLGASNEYTSTVRGLKPDAKKHQTYVDVQQLTGTPLQGGKRVQFNMFLKTINRITITENLTTVLMPAIWIDETSRIIFLYGYRRNSCYESFVGNVIFVQMANPKPYH
uniref:Sensory neuron membrane protein 2 n=1 Tax=Glossina pallidipes TaxID=7398 RepID=A0A1B0A289_GLOPL